MQGMVSLAVALALPSVITRGGGAFPQRIRIMVLTFTIVFVILARQGLALFGLDPLPEPGDGGMCDGGMDAGEETRSPARLHLYPHL